MDNDKICCGCNGPATQADAQALCDLSEADNESVTTAYNLVHMVGYTQAHFSWVMLDGERMDDVAIVCATCIASAVAGRWAR